MRELKFRIWWKDESEPSIYTEYDLFDDTWTNAERIAIEQYTGLKDKNGKEIYEGDIVKNVDNSLGDVGVIKFAEKLARFSVYWGMNPYMAKEINLDGLFIVGNIHENPELIKKEEDD